MNTEKPILFSTDMVQAILEGRKTQTRRILKIKGCKPFTPEGPWTQEDILRWNKDYHPYGKPGDLLWVRETFAHTDQLAINPEDENFGYVYKADDQPWEDYTCWKWKPSIHMPKAASRIWLLVEDVRVERLHDISEQDCISEGIQSLEDEGEMHYYFYPCDDLRDDTWLDVPKTSFYSLWSSINGQESWNANPWVWAVTFKVLSTTGKPSNI